jgi:hypothetical protein
LFVSIHVQGKTPIAGKRSVGFSLWRPGKIDWFDPDADAPPLTYKVVSNERSFGKRSASIPSIRVM